ncbi:hypothetical protein PHMEG_0008321 [Phytophthora megakarya]|uniref:PDZ domain-containing protein n=1 Tax=Phytophthora megakarya TaxID=4795 RepID=A0A225WJ35_9STRA|nr:hypothetical protein PHMEG_0008321 [Phytophthora megakarya]
MASASQGRQIHVQLTLHDGERSFGMSLAQRSSVLGPKYTVVSSVFANSPADRAGVRKGYVVRYIDDKPMGGLTVAQVANHFRNVAQAKITLEVVEIPGASAFTAVAFGGAIANKVTTQTERPTPPVTGFSTVSSGRAIAAPGSALAVPTVSAPKEAVLRFGAKPTAKMVGSSSETGLDSTKSAPAPRADSKPTRRESQTGLKSNTVTPVLRLGPKPKPVQPEKMTVMTSNVELKPASTCVPTKPSSASAANKQPTTTGKTGKKRGRPRKNQAAANGTTNNKTKGKGKAKKTQKQQPEAAEVDAIMDDENVFEYFAFSSDSEVDESPSPKRKGRRRGVTDRTRHSLTIDRLLGMGFTREDAEASVKEFGDDPDACMVWIVSRIEERNFTEDLNRASIQSEQSKRDEEKRKKKREKETQAQAEKFMALFPTVSRTCWNLLGVWTLNWERTVS